MSPALVVAGPQTEAKENEQEFLLGLAERIKRHDRDAFAELVRLFQKKIFSFAYGFFHNREDALEVVQETFMRVHEKIDSYRPEHSLQSWIYRLAHNICVDYYRKYSKKKKRECGLDDVPDRQLAVHADAQSVWEARLVAESIDRAVENLSLKQKEVFLLKYRQGMKLQQVAEAMAISIGTVKALHHRALNRIRREVAPGPRGEHESMS
jgi:RNA polymerase sigma-70 factor (ECF subfamily)